MFNNLDYSLDQMLEIADEIMYQVKKSGKNMVKTDLAIVKPYRNIRYMD